MKAPARSGVLLLALAIIGVMASRAAAADPCKRSCSAQKQACRTVSRTAYQAGKADCSGTRKTKRQCLKAARGALRAAANACRGFASECRDCCKGGGTSCDVRCGDGIVSSGEDCDPPGSNGCAAGAACDDGCRCPAPAPTTSSTVATTTSTPGSSDTTTSAPGSTDTTTTVPVSTSSTTLGCVPTGAEKCDGVDNDCDGDVDEGLGTKSCGGGACQVSVPACVDGVTQTCDPHASDGASCPIPCKVGSVCSNGFCQGGTDPCAVNQVCHVTATGFDECLSLPGGPCFDGVSSSDCLGAPTLAVCRQGTCLVRLPGLACPGPGTCNDGLACLDGTCVVGVGATCADDGDCTIWTRCSCQKQVCDPPGSDNCQCDGVATCHVPPGFPCARDSECGFGYACQDSTCQVSKPKLGEECLRYGPGECADDLVCSCPGEVRKIVICDQTDPDRCGTFCEPSGTCRVDSGDPCSQDSDCEDGTYCPAGICVRKPFPLGAFCGRDPDQTFPYTNPSPNGFLCDSGTCYRNVASGGPALNADYVCCQDLGESCTADTDCCKAFAAPARGCGSAHTCRELAGEGGACGTDADCLRAGGVRPADLECKAGTCTAPAVTPTNLGPGAVCNPDLASDQCDAGQNLYCQSCEEEGRGYRCVDKDAPCCRNGGRDVDWCGGENNCCNWKCAQGGDINHCGYCENDCEAEAAANGCFDTPRCREQAYCTFSPTCGPGSACYPTPVFNGTLFPDEDWTNVTCVPLTLEPTKGLEGWPCDADTDCLSGLCTSSCVVYSQSWCTTDPVCAAP